MTYSGIEVHKFARKMSQLDHEVYTSREVVEDAKAWCQERWGTRWSVLDNRQGTWSVFWAGVGVSDQYRWSFATEQQAILFSLRWS